MEVKWNYHINSLFSYYKFFFFNIINMTRPRRLYTTAEGKFYYLIDGKKKFVKAPAGVSEKQIARINIKNIVNVPSAKRIKRRRKRIEPAYGKKVGGVLQKSDTGGLPIYFFNPSKKIPTIEEQAKASDDTTTKQLTNLIQETKNTQKLLQGITAAPSSSKIQPTIASERPRPALTMETSKRGAPTGKRGEIGTKQLGKTLYAELGATGTVLSKEELEEKIPSEFILTAEKYKAGLEEAGKQAFATPEGKQNPLYQKALDKRLSRDTESSKAKKVTGGGDGDGLYNDEISKIVKKRIKNYVPVIAADEINELPRYVARGDKRFGFVINTNPSSSDGSGNDGYRTGHWRAVYINNEDDYPTVEYFDPLAEGKMPPELVTMTRKIAMKMNPSMMFKYKQNMLRRQSKMTSNCGHHSIKFLDDRYNGVPYADATGYTDYMEQHSSAPDDSQDGERDIAKAIKKYESYI
jgi:hypothetical protein